MVVRPFGGILPCSVEYAWTLRRSCKPCGIQHPRWTDGSTLRGWGTRLELQVAQPLGKSWLEGVSRAPRTGFPGGGLVAVVEGDHRYFEWPASSARNWRDKLDLPSKS